MKEMDFVEGLDPFIAEIIHRSRFPEQVNQGSVW
jgi:hypothetical protein